MKIKLKSFANSTSTTTSFADVNCILESFQIYGKAIFLQQLYKLTLSSGYKNVNKIVSLDKITEYFIFILNFNLVH